MSSYDQERNTRDAPLYDNWRRAIPGTGTHALVLAAIEATADLRARPNGRDSVKPRKRKEADQRTYEAIAHAVVSALVHRELSLPGGATRIPLAHQRTGRKGKDECARYRSPAMSRGLPSFVHRLSQLGWLTLERGYLERKERVPSTMRASIWLVQRVKALGCQLSDFTRDPDQELIILKGRKPEGRDGRGRQFAAPWIDYIDTRETARMRSEMHELNRWLAAADIDYTLSGAGIDPIGDRDLRRVFNNGSFEEGGRLAGGFWSNMSMSPDKGELWRGHIRIELEHIVALDFVSMFMRLLYFVAGVQPPSGDLLAGIEGLGPEHRIGVKRIVYSMLFQEGELTRCPRGARPFLPKGSHIKSLVRSIKQRHAPVADLFGAGMGMRLFRLESDILLEVLRQCRAMGFVALPVHDAILVAESRAEAAREAMLAGFESVTGFRGEVGEPKRPEVGAAELETMQMPDEMRNLEADPRELKRVEELVRLGERGLAERFAERQQFDGVMLAPDAEADWI